MKKRSKTTLRTKIYLAMVGLLSLTGAVYAATPIFFGQFIEATGIAISPTHMYATAWCSQNFASLNCAGNVSVLGMIPLGNEPCIEKYLSIAPRQSIAAGFTPTDVFITEGQNIFKYSPSLNTITFFAQVGCPFSDHTAVTFDHVGTFGFNMIVTCENGPVFTVDGTGVATFIASTTDATHITHIEGPAIPPLSFGPLGGQILVADDDNGLVYAIKNDGTVTYNAFNWSPPVGKGAENVHVIPATPCTFGCTAGGPGAFFQMLESADSIIYYGPTDFAGLGGNVIVTSEAVPPDTSTGTLLVKFVGGTYITSLFDGTFNFTVNEGANFVDCDAVTPTPTPTATSTPTSTPTATATATPTPTATATPTATPSGFCPLTIGYWKNHSNAWPVNSLMLGSQTYTKAELLNILNNPGGGDASMILAVQLIAAKLNIAAGSDPTPISSTITHADSLLAMFSGKLPYHVAPSSSIGQMMVSDGSTLDNYNNGHLTPHCSGQRSQPTQAGRPAPRPR